MAFLVWSLAASPFSTLADVVYTSATKDYSWFLTFTMSLPLPCLSKSNKVLLFLAFPTLYPWAEPDTLSCKLREYFIHLSDTAYHCASYIHTHLSLDQLCP